MMSNAIKVWEEKGEEIQAPTRSHLHELAPAKAIAAAPRVQ